MAQHGPWVYLPQLSTDLIICLKLTQFAHLTGNSSTCQSRECNFSIRVLEHARFLYNSKSARLISFANFIPVSSSTKSNGNSSVFALWPDNCWNPLLAFNSRGFVTSTFFAACLCASESEAVMRMTNCRWSRSFWRYHRMFVRDARTDCRCRATHRVFS